MELTSDIIYLIGLQPFYDILNSDMVYSDDSFIRTRLFLVDISELTFSGLLNHSLVQTWKSVPTLFVWTSKIFGLSEPGLMNHHCTVHVFILAQPNFSRNR